MIKTLYSKFQHWSFSGSVWIISDLHFEDSDCKLMDPNWVTPLEQTTIINKYVFPSDCFICLGDCGDPEWFDLIRAKYKVLITGNHDAGANTYKPYFNEIYTGPLFIADRILLSHEPINLPFALNIHGHDHNNVECYNEKYKHINVAANVVRYKPINLGQIIRQGALSDIDNIHN